MAVLREALERVPTRLLTFTVMPNHWHLVVYPRADGELSAFVRWLTQTHSRRYHAHDHTTGQGPVYQGRFKSFTIQRDEHLLKVCRYVERNPLRAKLVERAEDWAWGGLHVRETDATLARELLARWPVERAADWVERVNAAESEAEVKALREALRRGRPFGTESWTRTTSRVLDLGHTPRDSARPVKAVM